MSHAEDGEDEIDEGEDAVQPQEAIPGGGEEGISERCGGHVACGSAWHSVSHPWPPLPPSRTSPSQLPDSHPRDERGSVQGVG